MTSLWIGGSPLVLASGSAARRSLLEAAGIPLDIRPAAVDERVVEQRLRQDGASAAGIAAGLARVKALRVSETYRHLPVLGADQVLALDDRVFSKPGTIAEAQLHLEALSGRTHSLQSAWALAQSGRIVASGVAEARLTMRVLTPVFLDAYLAIEGDGVRSSVGGYKLEGLGVHLFATIEGDHSTILGLPMIPVLAALRQTGFLLG